MEHKELMIVDWMLINGVPHRIQAIDDIDAEIQADNTNTMYYVGEDRYHSEDEISGVRITSEILEKNGFNSGLTPLEEALSELDDFDDDFREDNEDTKVRPDAFFKEHWSYTGEGVELNLYASGDLKKGNLFVDELRLKGHLEFTFQDCLYVQIGRAHV